MESRFANLRQRDSSVSMLRVKLSRRRSQSLKENRERAVNTRRQLEKLSELDRSSLDVSVIPSNMSIIREKPDSKTAKTEAGMERLKQLQRWKERKLLEKEKVKRGNEKKNIFKTGLYHPHDAFPSVGLPLVPKTKPSTKEASVKTSWPQTTTDGHRVTRSVNRQQQTQKSMPPQKDQGQSTTLRKVEPALGRVTRSRTAVSQPAPPVTRAKAAGEPVGRALSTRSANRPTPTLSIPKVNDKPTAVKSNVKKGVAPSGKASTNKVAHDKEQPILVQHSNSNEEQKARPLAVTYMEADPEPDPVEALPSFAPQGFLFQAPVGVSNFKFEPLTPRSAGSFLTPSSSFTLPPVPSFDFESCPELSSSSPPEAPLPSLAHTSPTSTPAPQMSTLSPQEPVHDVPYFRFQMVIETDKLTSLCHMWESKVEDESIPEEVRDRMRTAVGQARLLMKERFGQFSGLVDDCELGRGEKITTCTDLQGFWDMVYFQVEDVDRKFAALKEAEARNWVEEMKPRPQQKKGVKKPPTAAPKPVGTTNAAARSRLAAVKAAMRAKQQQATEAAKAARNTEEDGGSSSQQAEPPTQCSETIMFHGGFFQVESPAKPTGSARKSVHLRCSALPQSSPRLSLTKYTTPGRVTRRSLAMMRSSPAPAAQAPTGVTLAVPQSPYPGEQIHPPQVPGDGVSVSLCFSPVKEHLPSDMPPEEPDTHLQSDPLPGQEGFTSDLGSEVVSERAGASEASCLVLADPLTTTSVVQSQEEQPAANIPPSSPGPQASSLSFSLSPCSGPATPARQAAAASCLPSLSSLPSLQFTVESQESMSESPDNSVIEYVPGLDFERYLQPTARCSLPTETSDAEMLSPMAVDIEMGSPTAESGDLQPQDESLIMTPTGLHGTPSLSTRQERQAQTAATDLLLFTPDLRDRIRASVCPSDLMVFTPPNMQQE